MNKKGFTLIELLVATILLLIVIVGFLRGLLFYIQYSVREQTKNRAVEIMREIASMVESMPYCDDGVADCRNPFLRAYSGYAVSDWQNATCDITGQCSFENRDRDNDGLKDFREPYDGNNNASRSNPLSTANWLNIRPGGASFCKNNRNTSCTREEQCQGTGPCVIGCVDRNGNQIQGLLCGELYKGRWVYTGTTLARLVRYNVEVGKAVGVVVWHFDPSTGEYKGYATTVMRDKK